MRLPRDGNTYEKSYANSAPPVAIVMGKYSPAMGDSAIYDALGGGWPKILDVLPAADAKGNFGSIGAVITRCDCAYKTRTEWRMDKPGRRPCWPISKKTTSIFRTTYDGKDLEPTVSCPQRFPNMLVNGAGR